MSDEQKRTEEPEIVTQDRHEQVESPAQITPEGTVQTQASAAADGAVGSPDSTNGKNDTNVNNGKKRGKLIGLLAAAAVLIAAVIGISIYNAPSNRMSRAL